jgi:enoyl-CoA hydratase/3-hydroxyacyl-CoA dehydrogenase
MIAVIGFGTMGRGISQFLAIKGQDVTVYDMDASVLDRGLSDIRSSLQMLKARGQLPGDVDEVMSRIKVAKSIPEACKDANLVIEAVYEDPEVKSAVLREAERHSPPHAVLTTNTSGLSITYLQLRLVQRERFAGFHWFNPPGVMQLIEVIRGRYTGEEVLESLRELALNLGKWPIVVRKDLRGFVANRIARALRYNAIILYKNEVYTHEEIDAAAVYKLGLPLGPFAVADFTNAPLIEVTESQHYHKLKEEVPDWEPHRGYETAYWEAVEFLKSRMEAGKIGVKSGEGFYKYPQPGRWEKPKLDPELAERVSLPTLVAPAYIQARYLVEIGVADVDEVEKAMVLGYRWSHGPFTLSNKIGIEDICRSASALGARFPHLSEFYSGCK